jgi:hypothetical protein
MSFVKALVYFFDDPRWPHKVAIAVLVAAVPVLGYFAIKGWEFEISAGVRRGQGGDLPGWADLPGKLLRGFIIRLAGFLYNIPTWTMLALGGVLWVRVLVQFLQQEATTFAALLDVVVEGLGPRLALLAATALVALVCNILYWSGYLRYIDTPRFAAFFEIGPNLRMAFRTVWDDLLVAVYLVVFTAAIGAAGGLLTGALGLTGIGAALAPIVLPALTFTLSSLFSGHLYGQLAARTLDSAG